MMFIIRPKTNLVFHMRKMRHVESAHLMYCIARLNFNTCGVGTPVAHAIVFDYYFSSIGSAIPFIIPPLNYRGVSNSWSFCTGGDYVRAWYEFLREGDLWEVWRWACGWPSGWERLPEGHVVISGEPTITYETYAQQFWLVGSPFSFIV